MSRCHVVLKWIEDDREKRYYFKDRCCVGLYWWFPFFPCGVLISQLGTYITHTPHSTTTIQSSTTTTCRRNGLYDARVCMCVFCICVCLIIIVVICVAFPVLNTLGTGEPGFISKGLFECYWLLCRSYLLLTASRTDTHYSPPDSLTHVSDFVLTTKKTPPATHLAFFSCRSFFVFACMCVCMIFVCLASYSKSK